MAGNVVPGLPLADALREVFPSVGSLYTLVYAVGLVLVLRNQVRLGSAAKIAAWGYSLLLVGNLSSAATRVARLTQDTRLIGEDRIFDAGVYYVFATLNLAASLAGAVCLLMALLKTRTGSGPG